MKRDFLSLSDLGPGGIERLLEVTERLHKTRGTPEHPRVEVEGLLPLASMAKRAKHYSCNTK